MAITPIIEKAILNGWGELKTYSVIGGLAKIETPKGHFGIITKVEYFPWQQYPTAIEAGLLTNINLDTFQEICIYSRNRSYKSVFKVNFGIAHWQGASIDPYYFPVQSYHKDVYFIVDSDIYINFKNPFLMAVGAADYTLLNNTQAPAAPETQGTVYGTIVRIDNGLNTSYFPAGTDGQGGNQVNNKYTTTSNAIQAVELYPTTAPQNNYQLAAANIDVVFIAEQNRNNLST